MTQKYYGFDLDELWDEFERIQDGLSEHRIAIKGETKDEAVNRLLELIKPFIKDKMYPSDENGYAT